MPRPVEYLVVHCNGVDGRTWRDILRTHLGQGWATIGYHKVIHEDGSRHNGRDESRIGAHVSGFNKTPKGRSLAVCLIGNLDKHPPTEAQWSTLCGQLAAWCLEHNLDPMTAILGHAETRPFIRPPFIPTKKSCPGKFVNMHLVRKIVATIVRVQRGG